MNSSDPKYARIYKTFKDDYGKAYTEKTGKALEMPKQFLTSMIFMSPDYNETDSIPPTNKVAVLKIEKLD